MQHLALLLSKYSLQVKTMYQIATECNTYFQNVLGLPNYCFKKHPNAPIPVLIFQKKRGLRSRGLLHTPLMTSKHVLFLLMAVSNIVSKSVTIMHAKASLCQNDLCSFEYGQNAPFSVYFFLSEVPNTVKMHHLLSLISIFFTAVPNSFGCRQNALINRPCLKKISLQFQMLTECTI